MCLTIFFSILSPLQSVSYVKVHVYCVFDYFLFNLVSTSVGELRESACLLCVWLFSLQSCLHFSMWVTWKCMFIVCLTIFSSILSPLQSVSYVKVHVYCVFDYFLFNLVSTSVGELRESACLLCVWLFSLQSCLHFSGELRESACLLCVWLFSLQSCLHFSGELRESACLLCVWLFSLQSCLHFSGWVTWKCMFIVCLTIFSSILSPLQRVSYVKVHVYCVFDYFLFNLVSTSGGELRESACLLCVWLFSLQSCLHFSYVVSYVKVHVYCVFDYFLFNLVSTSDGELRESACLLCVWLFSLQSCLHLSRWVTWKCMFIVCLTIFSSILSPLQIVSYVKVHVYCVFDYFLFNLVSTSVVSYVKVHVYCVFDYFLFNLVSTSAGELRESVCLLCVWLFSFQSCLHFSRWVTWKCMFIVCLTIFSSILSPLQSVSYVKVHVYCVFDYFLFNLVSTSAVSYVKVHVYCVFDYFLFNLVSTSVGELRESACLLCVWLFSLQSCLHFSRWVTWKCMFIVCLTIFSSILSPLQSVSYVKVHVYCVFDYFLFNLVSTSVCELRESACLLCVWLFSLQSCLHFSGELRESACLLCVWLFSLQSCLHFSRWVTWKCMFIVCLTIFSSILSPLQSVSYVKVHVYCVFDYFLFNLVSTSVGELRESACLLCVWLFSLQSCLHFSRWVTWKCMFIVCLTIFSSILSPLQHVSYVKVHVYCVFDYFLFNLVSTSVGELRESACLLCVWLFSLQSCLHFSRWVTWKCMFIVCLTIFSSILSPLQRWVTWKCMFIVCLTIFSSILSPLQPVSYVKVHVYCVFDYFLFNLVSTSVGELRESACLLCVWLFSLQSCLHFSRWVTWKCMFIVCLTIFSSILSPLQRWVTWKCMFIVCLTIFSSILSPLQSVSYVKVHVYCVFDYFLFNLVSTSVGELRESACLLCVWLFSLQSCLHFSRWVTWKCMFIVCLTIFSSILSPLQSVSYVKVHVYCVFDYFLFNLVSTSVGELRESACLLCVWLFSLQSCLHFSRWVTWKCMFIVCLTIFSSILSPLQRWVTWKCMFIVCLTIFSSILSPLQSVSYVKVHVYCVFDYFLFNLVSTSVGELRESACLLCVWLFSLQSCLHFSRWVTWKCMFIVCLTIFSSILSPLQRWVTWKCMFIVCLTIFSSILSPLQSVSYVKVHVYCVFDYFLFNLVSTSDRWVTWKCMFIVCLTIFSSILSPLQVVSYVKVHVYCVFDYFLFNLVSTSVGELRESACLLCVWLFSLQSCLHFSGELRESACLLCVWLFSLQSCLHFSRWVTWKCMFIVCLTIFSSILSPLQSVSYVKVHVYCVFDYFLFNLVSTSACELRESACLLCVWLFSLQSCLHFSRWVTWKCMFIVCLTIFSSILSPLQSVSYVKVHVYCVFDYFLFNLVSTSGVSYVKVHVYCVFDYFLFNLVSTSVGELRESACLLCVWLFSLTCLHFSYGELRESACLLCVWLFSLQSCLHFSMVSYVKVHVYCVFDYFLFNLVSTSVGELRESACLLCVWLFSLQSCLHFRWWVTWKCMFIVCLTIFSSILSPLQPVSYVKVHVYCVFDYFLFNLVSTSVGELRESACLLCVWLFSLQSCLHFSRWVTWKCMFIVCLTIFSSILSPLQHVSYVKVHVYCVFDYFLFNLVSTSVGELRESACLLCVWLFSLQSCLHFSRWVTWKCMFIVCLTIFSSILSPLQSVSYVKVHVYCVFDYFLFNLVSTSAGELRESACLLCVWLFSLQSCLHFSGWVTWKCMFIVCLTIFSSILSPLQRVSYVKVHVYCVFDYFLFNLVSTSGGELRESACLLCLTIFSSILSPLQHVSYVKVTWKCMFIVCLTIFSSILSPLQMVSYVKVHVYCVFDYFLFNLVSTSVGELRESACLLCVWLFSLQSCLHFSGELRESACLLCVWLFSLQSCLHFRWWVTWKCMFIVCLTIFSSILSAL